MKDFMAYFLLIHVRIVQKKQRLEAVHHTQVGTTQRLVELSTPESLLLEAMKLKI